MNDKQTTVKQYLIEQFSSLQRVEQSQKKDLQEIQKYLKKYEESEVFKQIFQELRKLQ